ncbi:MAG: GNAT family N-acetyltransferase [Clostridia bacterium]|nr:GNAT family N-acetyltransferase [Clostridia bacterium]
MLDKSVPYLNVLMKRKAGTPIPAYSLPEGYSIVHYRKGDEKDWARIEMSVLEFDSEESALKKFREQILWAEKEVERRTLFLLSPEGKKIGTSMIWWEYSGVRRDPWVSWVSIMPEYQGKGLSKALISYLMNMAVEIEGDRDFYLHTQTWSHRAIKLYEKFGFEITEEPNLFKYKNDEYEEARAVLEKIYSHYPKDRR